MDSKDYLEIRKKQDLLLFKINDTTPDDDPLIDKLLSLQDTCDEFERNTFHKEGYDEIQVELDKTLVVTLIREAHKVGMNVSDFVSLLIAENLDKFESFTWTTDVRHIDNTNKEVIAIPESISDKLGWNYGDFVSITVTNASISITKYDFDKHKWKQNR